MVKKHPILKKVRNLRLKSGDILIVETPHPKLHMPAIERMAQQIRKANPGKEIAILLTMPGVDIINITEETLNAAGWIRRPEPEIPTPESIVAMSKAHHELERGLPGAKKEGCAEGETCNRDGCQGTMVLEPPYNCTCFQNAPCSACMGRNVVCDECGEAALNGD